MYDFDNDPSRIKDKLFVSMSGNFLTNALPVEAIDWDTDRVEAWIDENRWEPIEYWDAHLVVETIADAADHAYRFMKFNFEGMTNAT
jgi:hypothetical protein